MYGRRPYGVGLLIGGYDVSAVNVEFVTAHHCLQVELVKFIVAQNIAFEFLTGCWATFIPDLSICKFF
jgi:hypothetical protein